jgi:NAD(P)-dependent dehydrogenase (short-subunit alcohol dehydrogenase family)
MLLIILARALLSVQTAGDVVGKVVQELGRLDILVNNASVQHLCTEVTNITPEQLQETFAINVFGYFYMAQVGRVLALRVSLQPTSLLLSVAVLFSMRRDV